MLFGFKGLVAKQHPTNIDPSESDVSIYNMSSLYPQWVTITATVNAVLKITIFDSIIIAQL